MLDKLKYKSPADIPDNLGLNDLENIKRDWIAAAQDERIPDMLYEIGMRLGSGVKTLHSGTHKVLIVGQVEIYVGEGIEERSFAAAAWICKRRVCVHHIKLGGRKDIVCFQEWEFNTDDDQRRMGEIHRVNNDQTCFIPGRWTEIIAPEYAKATGLQAEEERQKIEAKRKQIMADLLVGMDI